MHFSLSQLEAALVTFVHEIGQDLGSASHKLAAEFVSHVKTTVQPAEVYARDELTAAEQKTHDEMVAEQARVDAMATKIAGAVDPNQNPPSAVAEQTVVVPVDKVQPNETDGDAAGWATGPGAVDPAETAKAPDPMAS